MSDRNWDEHHKWAALSVNNEDEDDDTLKRDDFIHRAEADEARARQKLHAGTSDVEPSEDLLLGSEAHHHHGAVEDAEALPGLVPRAGFHIRTNIPARMDRLPWGRWHWLVCLALGISWVLDGLEVTTVGIIGDTLKKQSALGISSQQVGIIGTVYIAGAVFGSLVFGWLADKYGRKKFFVVTPAIILCSSFATAFSWDYYSFLVCNFFTGLGIGGEYSAMNSAINEFIPARVRGIVDLAINGSYWMGAAIGATASLLFLDEEIVPTNLGWRLPFGIGAVICLFIIITRLFLPESPRWLMTHNRLHEAEEIVRRIEANIERQKNITLEMPLQMLTLKIGGLSFPQIVSEILNNYLSRAFLSLALMISQAFFYNAIFFTYALILTDFYGVDSADIGFFLIPFALGNFLGSVTIGRLFDTVGRKPMIFITYMVSAILLIITGVAFTQDWLTSVTQTVCWSIIFFFSSAGSSSAYLTIAEVFPLEIRAMSIAIFYSLGTGVGGLVGPTLFGSLVSSKDRWHLFYGYLLGAGLMMIAAIVVLFLGVNAEGKSLEEVAPPVNREEDDAVLPAADEDDPSLRYSTGNLSTLSVNAS